ncbi:MAG TPA: MgtC/SapB family protein [Caldimonas sp.]|nr:MgtC/SapB family protein [Caldimonas sp.]HEX2542096.1 MgtC/SapB family protein [Caldimonas sp.]
MWNEILETARQEFSDVPDVVQLTRLLLRLGLAMALGAIIGYERESRDSSAGLRTHMLVALGTALFVLVPLQAGMDADGMSRVIQGLLAGIGFLGAGAVIKQSESGHVRGLTTAAGIWTTAAIGMTVGLGRETTAIISTVLVLVILSLLLRLERRIVKGKEERGEISSGERQVREHDS